LSHKFFINPESILGTVARLFAADGAQLEVAVLTYSNPEIQETGYDNWNGGTTYFSLFLQVPITLYPQLESEKGRLEKSISDKLEIFLQGQQNEALSNVNIVPAIVDDPQWREKASAWLTGAKLTNQGRVRSSNVAPLTQDGLLFRSQPEIYLYKALKAQGVSFAPLPVFIRGGDSYSRIEPDFFLIHKGISLVVEVDGDTVHTETPAEAQARTRTLQQEGVAVERISASECNTQEKAQESANKIMLALKKLKEAK
jgi:hypothetical protein